DVCSSDLGIRSNERILLCVGGVEERKNTLRVLQAFIQLRAQMPDLQLVVAGGASLLDHSGYARAFHALLQASGCGSDVLLTGPLADDDMPGLFRLANVLAMPSLSEGFGLVVLEALCSGVPVVASQIAPFTDYLQPGDSYPLNDFLQRTREALNIASERVRAKHGFACSQAMDQLADIESLAEPHRSHAGAQVLVTAFS